MSRKSKRAGGYKGQRARAARIMEQRSSKSATNATMPLAKAIVDAGVDPSFVRNVDDPAEKARILRQINEQGGGNAPRARGEAHMLTVGDPNSKEPPLILDARGITSGIDPILFSQQLESTVTRALDAQAARNSVPAAKNKTWGQNKEFYPDALEQMLDLRNYLLSKEHIAILQKYIVDYCYRFLVEREGKEAMDENPNWYDNVGRPKYGPAMEAMRDQITGMVATAHAALGQSEPMYVAPRIVDLVQASAVSFPIDFTATPALFPFPYGYVRFGKVVHRPMSEEEVEMHPTSDNDYTGFIWAVVSELTEELEDGSLARHTFIGPPQTERETPAVGIFFLARQKHYPAGSVQSMIVWPYDTPLSQIAGNRTVNGYHRLHPTNNVGSALQTETDDIMVERAEYKLKLACAFLSFMQSDYLVTTQYDASRATRKRIDELKRKDPAQPTPDASVRVVELRRRKYVREGTPSSEEAQKGIESASSGQESVEKEHNHYDQWQWLVAGHWRQQPYGPKRGLRRAQWIAGFVKGPDGRPMKTPKKTIFAVVR